MIKAISRRASRILDYIYPAQCELCQCELSHGRHLCVSCTESLEYTHAPFCKLCGACYDGHITSDFSCSNCHNLMLNFEFAHAPLQSDKHGRALLHDSKYRRQIHLSGTLGELLYIGLNDPRFEPYLQSGIIIPVPLHASRLRRRKFNQADELAIQIAKRTNLRTVNGLKRIRNTATQTRFSRAKRLENLRGAFQLNTGSKKHIAGKYIILVDDIFTTGSTANECTKVLLNNGAARVAVLTLMRG